MNVNRAWQTFRQDNGLTFPNDGLGSNYLNLCEASGQQDLTDVAAGFGWVLSGEASEYVKICACRAAERWC